MSLSQTAHSVNSTIDLILSKGATKLYDKYLANKLPQHVYLQNHATFYNNLDLNTIVPAEKGPVNVVPVTNVQMVPIDNQAVKHIASNKQSEGSCDFSPKQTQFGLTTKYQTAAKSQRTSIGN